MKVAIFTHRYFPSYVGGGERLAQLTAAGLRDASFSPVILTTTTSIPAEREFDGVRVFEIAVNTSSGALNEESLRDAFLRACPDVIHIVGSRGSAAVSDLATALRIPVGLAAVDYSLVCANGTLVRTGGGLCDGPHSLDDCVSCRLEGARRRDKILASVGKLAGRERLSDLRALTEATLGKGRMSYLFLKDVFGERADSLDQLAKQLICVVHGTGYSKVRHERSFKIAGVHKVLRHPLDRRQVSFRSDRLEAECITVGFLGRALVMKGIELLFEAVQKVRSETPLTLRVITPVNGEEISYRSRLIEISVSLGIKVEWVDGSFFSSEQLDDVFQGIDVLAVPSLWPEYVGLVCLEALARGVPVIVSDYEPQCELFGGNPFVRFFTAGSSESLAGALEETWDLDGVDISAACSSFPTADEYAIQLVKLYESAMHGFH